MDKAPIRPILLFHLLGKFGAARLASQTEQEVPRAAYPAVNELRFAIFTSGATPVAHSPPLDSVCAQPLIVATLFAHRRIIESAKLSNTCESLFALNRTAPEGRLTLF